MDVGPTASRGRIRPNPSPPMNPSCSLFAVVHERGIVLAVQLVGRPEAREERLLCSARNPKVAHRGTADRSVCTLNFQAVPCPRADHLRPLPRSVNMFLFALPSSSVPIPPSLRLIPFPFCGPKPLTLSAQPRPSLRPTRIPRTVHVDGRPHQLSVGVHDAGPRKRRLQQRQGNGLDGGLRG